MSDNLVTWILNEFNLQSGVVGIIAALFIVYVINRLSSNDRLSNTLIKNAVSKVTSTEETPTENEILLKLDEIDEKIQTTNHLLTKLNENVNLACSTVREDVVKAIEEAESNSINVEELSNILKLLKNQDEK